MNSEAISRRYIAKQVASRPLPRNAIDVAALRGFRTDAEPQAKNKTYLWLAPRVWIYAAVFAGGVWTVEIVQTLVRAS